MRTDNHKKEGKNRKKNTDRNLDEFLSSSMRRYFSKKQKLVNKINAALKA